MENVDYKARYLLALKRRTRQLLSSPIEFAKRIADVTISGKYHRKGEELLMKEALAIWALVNPDGGFYAKARSSLLHKQGRAFRSYEYDEAINENVAEMSKNLERWADDTNLHTATVAMFMALPEHIARRWLWHENVDFQTCESFLRRISHEQRESLRNHYELCKGNFKDGDLPCFASGGQNFVWKLFGMKGETVPRLTAKSALSHNFFAMDMGFQQYPNATSDLPAPTSMTTQFLSAENRGEFVLNKENGGIYWYLFRTLRSNSLYRSDSEVTLGRWICPGFWFTMIAWLLFLVVSPALLLVGIVQWASSDSVPILLYPGLFTPSVLLLLAMKKFFKGKQFTKEYWENFGGTFFVLLCGFFFAAALSIAGKYLTYWAVILSVLLLIPYGIEKESPRVWEFPYLGKVLTLGCVALLARDIYMYTDFWEFLFEILVLMANAVWQFLSEYWVTIASVIGGIALMSLTFFTAASFLKLQEAKARAHEAGDTDVAANPQQYEWLLTGTATLIALVSSGAIAWLLQYELTLLVALGYIVAAVHLGMAFDAMFSSSYKFDANVVELSVQRIITKGFIKKYRSACLENSGFWIDGVTHKFRFDDLRRLVAYENCGAGLFLLFIRKIRSDVEMERVIEFLEYANATYWLHDFQMPSELASEVLSGVSPQEVMVKIKNLVAKEREATARTTKVLDSFINVLHLLWLGTLKFLLILVSPIRYLVKLLVDGYRIWKSFNEACPPAPREVRSALS